MRPRSTTRFALAGLGSGLAWLVSAGVVAAHGPVPDEPPSLANLLLGWTFEPLPTLALVAAGGWWWWAVRQVGSGAPGEPRAALPIDRIRRWPAGDRVRPPVGHRPLRHDPVLGPHGPARAADAGRGAAHRPGRPGHARAAAVAPSTRRRWILPVLHSRVMRVLSFPVVAWLVFAGVMWGAHFSPLFDAALEDPLDPRSRARALPRRGPPVLVAGGRPATRRRGGWATRSGSVHVPADGPEHVPVGGHPRGHDRPVRPLRDARHPVGRRPARRPAARGRDHVDRRRPDLPDRDPRHRLGVDAGRGTSRATGRPPRRCRDG